MQQETTIKTEMNNEQRTTNNLLIKSAWNFAYSVLWNGETFSIHETHLAKRLIKYHITQCSNPLDGYMQFCQRVLIAWEYVNKDPERFIPHPTLWLKPEYSYGYMGTESWYKNLLGMRAALPLYRHQYKALPEAILEMQDEPTAANFHYWRTWFLERNKQRALNLFLCILANGRYML